MAILGMKTSGRPQNLILNTPLEWTEEMKKILLILREAGCNCEFCAGVLGVCRDSVSTYLIANNLPTSVSYVVQRKNATRLKHKALGMKENVIFIQAAGKEVKIKLPYSLEVTRKMYSCQGLLRTYTPGVFAARTNSSISEVRQLNSTHLDL